MSQSSSLSALRIISEAGKIESGAFDYTLIPSLYMHEGILRLTWKVEVDKYKAWGGVYGHYADPNAVLPP